GLGPVHAKAPAFDRALTDQVVREACNWGQTRGQTPRPTYCRFRRVTVRLFRSFHDPAADTEQTRVGQFCARQDALRTRQAFARHTPRGVEAVQLRIRRLAGRGVFACRLPELYRSTLDVENVVHDLKGEAELARRAIDGIHL